MGNLHILPWDKAKHLSKMMSVIHQNLTVWLEINCMKKSALFIYIRVIFLVNISIVVTFLMVDLEHARYFDRD